MSAEGPSIAGFSGYTLICNTSKEPDLVSTSTLAVQWLDQRGSIIRDGVNFTISGSGPTTDTVLTSRLTFNNLYTSQAGVYTCKTLLSIPGTINNHPELTQFTVYVKRELNQLHFSLIVKAIVNSFYTVPAPLSPLMFHRSSHATLSAGLFFSLACVVRTSIYGVDTIFMVQSSITGPGISDTNRVNISKLVSIGESIYEKIVTFSYLIEADSGSYNCSAFITSSYAYVIASDSISTSESISVERKQPLNNRIKLIVCFC